jgi:hypothetical protein
MGGAGENTGTGDKLPTVRQHSMNLETQSDRTVR